MKQPKSILAFMNAYSSGKSGADMAFIEIFKRISGRKLTVVTSWLGQSLCKKENLAADYYLSSSEKVFENILPTYLKRIIKAVVFCLFLKNFDITYATSDSLPDVLPSFIFKFKNRKNSVLIQKIFHLIPKERKISHYAQKLSFFFIKRFADRIIVANEFIKEELIKLAFPKDRIDINYLGADRLIKNRVPGNGDRFDAVFMARLHESKGIFDLIQIWHNVVKKIPYVKLAIIGTGDKTLIFNLQKLISTLKLENNVELLDYLEDGAAFSLIKSSKVFLYPSREEGFGLVIGEVMACGVPIVTYDLPVYKNTFRKGLISVPIDNVNLFSEKVLYLLENERERKKTVQKAFLLSKQFTWDSTVKKELELMKK